MVGAIYAVIAGLFIGIQSIFNVRLSEKVGFWLTNAFVHGSGFIVSFILFLLIKDGSLAKLASVNKLYLLGGCMGVVIVFTAMKSVTALNPAYAIAILLIAQLIGTLAIESFGLFGVDKVALSANRLIGIGVMIAGVVVFKYK
ncbi:DMT family transporter [Cohnella luojiensis]|uniref:DMT family transporter n=1 Tax=Cohnella luojiensis TaxID=652876 RepID=A0A4Y8LPZ1_9BACL|nr:DMT family transporter [Cohnella luojiensis]TFE19701.1 DMT family transporter [Cohnella luojiensis]